MTTQEDVIGEEVWPSYSGGGLAGFPGTVLQHFARLYRGAAYVPYVTPSTVSVRLDGLLGDLGRIFGGGHSGLTPEEMLIPLVSIRL